MNASPTGLHRAAPAFGSAENAPGMERYCDQADFKAAMRRHAGTVAIITANAGGKWYGMAATAVTAVSADPPSLLICVNRSASIHPVLMEADRLCVNLLSDAHLPLIRPFGTDRLRSERFTTGDWRLVGDDGPILQDAQALLVCFVERRIDHHTHTIFIAGVQDVAVNERIKPLVYQDGAYCEAVPLNAVG